MQNREASFQSLCDAASLTVEQAASRLGLADRDLLSLLNGSEVPVNLHNALKAEAIFPEIITGIPELPLPASGPANGREMTCVSLFSGAGGLDIGLEQAGFSTIFASDIEGYAHETLQQNKIIASLDRAKFDTWFSSVVAAQRCYAKASANDLSALKERLRLGLAQNFRHLSNAVIRAGDVRSLAAEGILTATGQRRGNIALMAGGPPCQPFSRAGKREMVGCEKGQLFMDFVRLVDGVRPRWFLFENVKGLILHGAEVASGKCVHCLTEQLIPFENRESLRSTDTCELLCGNCGSARSHQIHWKSKRAGSLDIIRAEFERLGYKCYDKILNAADFGAPQSRERIFIVGSRDHEEFFWPDATHMNPKLVDEGIVTLFEQKQERRPWTTTREAIFANGHWRYGELDKDKAVLWVKNVVRPHDEPVTWSLNRIAPTVGAHQSAKLAIAPYGVPEAQLTRQQWHVLGRRQGDTPPVFVEHEYLTDAELLALQTFPRSWYLHGTRMERAFQIGNAVPPILAQAVGEAIMKACGISGTSDGGHIAYACSI